MKHGIIMRVLARVCVLRERVMRARVRAVCCVCPCVRVCVPVAIYPAHPPPILPSSSRSDAFVKVFTRLSPHEQSAPSVKSVSYLARSPDAVIGLLVRLGRRLEWDAAAASTPRFVEALHSFMHAPLETPDGVCCGRGVCACFVKMRGLVVGFLFVSLSVGGCV